MRTDEAKALAMIVFDVVVVILTTLVWIISTFSVCADLRHIDVP